MPLNEPRQVSDIDRHRGIRNPRTKSTSERFVEKTGERLLSSELLGAVAKRRFSANDPRTSTAANDERFSKREADTLEVIRRELRNESGEIGEFLEPEDAEQLVVERPVAPDFPYFMVAIAVLKDFLDVPADLSVVAIPMSTALSFLIALVLFFWLLGKMSGGWWKKKLIRWLWVRYIIAIAIEFIPVLKIVPATTILVLMAHFRETKIVRAFDASLQRLHASGIKV